MLSEAWDPSLPPVQARRRLRAAPVKWPDLVLLFGSAGRGEAARDLDLLVIDGCGADRSYERVPGALDIDLNVAGEAWLEQAWRDPEWGYCVAESWVVSGERRLVESWRRSANAFWRPETARRRIVAYRDWADLLMRRAQETRGHVARLLAHEAHRLAAVAIIDQFGRRPWSHRSMEDELRAACEVAGYPASVLQRVLAGLMPSRGTYANLRRQISSVLRSPDAGRAIGYRAGDPKARRVRSLVDGADSTAFGGLVSHLDVPAWYRVREGPPSEVFRPVRANRQLTLVGKVPTLGDAVGVRWVEERGARVKIVLRTGGCRVPTCAFCALPVYGRSGPKVAPAHALAMVLRGTRCVDIAIYTDGSFFDSAEVSSSDRHDIACVLRDHGARDVWVEANPRFLWADEIAAFRDKAGIRQLTVGMGLQMVGSAVACRELGRPDADALFDHAIEEVHAAGARTRVYLMWGFRWDAVTWNARLLESVRWCLDRGVDQVTVSPYVPPDGGPSPDLSPLREMVGNLSSRGEEVEVVWPDRASCAPRSAGSEE